MPSRWSGSALVERDGVVLAEVAEGLSAGPGSEPWSGRTRSQAGSVSKQVVAAVALALAEQGEVDLHEPVARRLPEAPSSWGPITLHHLLTQTSGIGHWSELGLAPLDGDPPARDDLVELAARTPLGSPPGERWLYSSPGSSSPRSSSRRPRRPRTPRWRASSPSHRPD